METTVDLLRHGEPVGGSRYRGHGIDDPLTERGWEQMLRGIGGFQEWDYIVTSPLERCAEFARHFAELSGIPMIQEPGFKEIGFGVWEGMTKAQLLESRAEEFTRFYQNPLNNTPEGAEPVTGFYGRIARQLDLLLEQQKGKHVLVIAHAGVIRAAITYALGIGPEPMYRLNIDNGRVTRLRFMGGRGKLDAMNICLPS